MRMDKWAYDFISINTLAATPSLPLFDLFLKSILLSLVNGFPPFSGHRGPCLTIRGTPLLLSI